MWTRPHTGTTSVGAPGGRSVGDRRCKVLLAQKNESAPLAPPPLSWNQTRRLPISPSRRPLLRRRSGTLLSSLLASLPPGGTNRTNCLTLPLFLRGGPTAPTVSPCLWWQSLIRPHRADRVDPGRVHGRCECKDAAVGGSGGDPTHLHAAARVAVPHHLRDAKEGSVAPLHRAL